MYYAELNVPKNHIYLFKPHFREFCFQFFELRFSHWRYREITRLNCRFQFLNNLFYGTT